jgi:hypothetical protein
VLSIADGVDAFVYAFTIVVETECAGGNVEGWGELGEETLAEEGFAGAADANEKDNQLVGGIREDTGDGFRVGRELAIMDFGILQNELASRVRK